MIALTTLTGSDVQTEWATDIRNKFIPQVKELLADQHKRLQKAQDENDTRQIRRHKICIRNYKNALQFLCAIGSASWWIDRRNAHVAHVIDMAFQELAKCD